MFGWVTTTVSFPMAVPESMGGALESTINGMFFAVFK
jgi:hypothetical protein